MGNSLFFHELLDSVFMDNRIKSENIASPLQGHTQLQIPCLSMPWPDSGAWPGALRLKPLREPRSPGRTVKAADRVSLKESCGLSTLKFQAFRKILVSIFKFRWSWPALKHGEMIDLELLKHPVLHAYATLTYAGTHCLYYVAFWLGSFAKNPTRASLISFSKCIFFSWI